MATFNTMITANPTRPCWVEGRRAIFHRWTDSARPVKPRGMEEDESAERYQLHSVHALVEYEDGTMSRVWPTAVQFADSEQLFADYDWDAMEAQRDALPYTFDEVAEKKPTEETARNCLNCDYTNPYETHCMNIDHKCGVCEVDGCRCRYCDGANLWVPKVGSAL